jgi:hypothetical protein
MKNMIDKTEEISEALVRGIEKELCFFLRRDV